MRQKLIKHFSYTNINIIEDYDRQVLTETKLGYMRSVWHVLRDISCRSTQGLWITPTGNGYHHVNISLLLTLFTRQQDHTYDEL